MPINTRYKILDTRYKAPHYFFIFPILFMGCFFLFYAYDVRAVDEVKTVEYFVGQETSETASGTGINTAFTFFISDPLVATKSAMLEITGVSAVSASQSIQVSVDDSTFATGRAKTYTLDTSGRANEFRILYDATSYINLTAKGEYTYTLNVKATGAAVSLWGAKLIFTYSYTKYASEASSSVKTLKYFVGQQAGETLSATNVAMSHTFFIGDNLTVLKSAFYEITGISLATASQVIDLSIDNAGAGTCSKTFTLDTNGQSNHFRVLHDVTSCINVPSNQSENTRVFNVKGTGASVFIWSSRLIVTYQFTPISSGGFAATGNMISSTFDTAITNGAIPNSIMFLGTKPGDSTVKFQIASSNCLGGQTDSPTCSTGAWDYVGNDGTNATNYPASGSASSGTPVEIKVAYHNNKRYFRYKIILNSTTDQVSTPTVDDIILNWAP